MYWLIACCISMYLSKFIFLDLRIKLITNSFKTLFLRIILYVLFSVTSHIMYLATILRNILDTPPPPPHLLAYHSALKKWDNFIYSVNAYFSHIKPFQHGWSLVPVIVLIRHISTFWKENQENFSDEIVLLLTRCASLLACAHQVGFSTGLAQASSSLHLCAF